MYIMNCIRSKICGEGIKKCSVWTLRLPRNIYLVTSRELSGKVLGHERSSIIKNQSTFLKHCYERTLIIKYHSTFLKQSCILCRFYSDEVNSDTKLPKGGEDGGGIKGVTQLRESKNPLLHGEVTSRIPTEDISDERNIQSLRYGEVSENETQRNSNREMNHSQTPMVGQTDGDRSINITTSNTNTENTDSQELTENQGYLNLAGYAREKESSLLNKNLGEYTRQEEDVTEIVGLAENKREHESVTLVNEDFIENLPLSENDDDWTKEMEWIVSQETKDVPLPTKNTAMFNFANSINKSATLQQLVKLGVDLHQWEKRKNVSSFILPLDFEKDMKQYITFLHDKGVPAEVLGRWLTLNPFIFKEDLEDLEARVNYLEAMAFTPEQITRIVSCNPYWLLFSTKRIDNRLGFFQQTFGLSGSEVRYLATLRPRLITVKFTDVQRTNFMVLEEMGFTKSEMKNLLLSKPKLWTEHGVSVMRRFDYAHNVMGLSHDQLLQFPHILLSREFRIIQRHSYLKSIGRAQYDPKLPGYISPQQLVTGDDIFFCTELAKTSVLDFNDFLKTL